MARFAGLNSPGRQRLGIKFEDFGRPSNDYFTAGPSIGAAYNRLQQGKNPAAPFQAGLINDAELEMAADAAATAVNIAGINAKKDQNIGEIYKEAASNLNKKSGSSGIFGKIATGLGLGLQAASIFTASDRRVKNSVEAISDATEQLKQLEPVSFFYNDGQTGYDPSRKHYGFIAQEYQKVMPDATYTDDDSGYLCIDTNELIGLLVKSNQELAARVEKLENK